MKQQVYRFIVFALLSLPLVAHAALPEFTGIVEDAKDSVVNISTKQSARSHQMQQFNMPDLNEIPEGSPLGELMRVFSASMDCRYPMRVRRNTLWVPDSSSPRTVTS
jgi:S1-C subfamily serine protease